MPCGQAVNDTLALTQPYTFPVDPVPSCLRTFAYPVDPPARSSRPLPIPDSKAHNLVEVPNSNGK